MLPKVAIKNKIYKAKLVLARKVYKTKYITGEIPEFLNYGAQTLKLKMVLWDCSRNKVGGYTYLKIKCLIYR